MQSMQSAPTNLPLQKLQKSEQGFLGAVGPAQVRTRNPRVTATGSRAACLQIHRRCLTRYGENSEGELLYAFECATEVPMCLSTRRIEHFQAKLDCIWHLQTF